MKKVLIIDFNRTLYNPDREELMEGALDLLNDVAGDVRAFLLGKGDEVRKKLIDSLDIEHFLRRCLLFPRKI